MKNIFTSFQAPVARTIISAGVLLATGIATQAAAATLTVGPGKTYATPCRAFAAANAGDVVEINAGTYSGDVCAVSDSNLTIRGVNGRPKIDAAGKNALGKGTWVITGSNVVVENVEMMGATVPDRNGAAIRVEGTNFTLRKSFLHDNQNGILTGTNANSNIVIETTEFGRNGYGDGLTHNLYIGRVKSLMFRYNFSHDANIGHNLKSRASTNTILYNRFSSRGPNETGTTAAGKPSYEINLPNAGTSYIIGNVIQQPASNSNAILISYGEEGATNAGHDLYVVNNTMLNDDTSRGTFLKIGSTVTKAALLQNNILGGTGTQSTQATTVAKNNYRSAAPGFVSRATYDLRPTSSLVINAGSTPGTSPTGVTLKPVSQYKHVAFGVTRSPVGAYDIGAYEVAP